MYFLNFVKRSKSCINFDIAGVFLIEMLNSCVDYICFLFLRMLLIYLIALNTLFVLDYNLIIF